MAEILNIFAGALSIASTSAAIKTTPLTLYLITNIRKLQMLKSFITLHPGPRFLFLEQKFLFISQNRFWETATLLASIPPSSINLATFVGDGIDEESRVVVAETGLCPAKPILNRR